MLLGYCLLSVKGGHKIWAFIGGVVFFAFDFCFELGFAAVLALMYGVQFWLGFVLRGWLG